MHSTLSDQPVPAETANFAPQTFDSSKLHPMDLEDRQFDEPCDFDGDWDEIIAATQEDFLAGRFAFNSGDYPTDEAAMEAMKQHFEDILREVIHESSASLALDAQDA